MVPIIHEEMVGNLLQNLDIRKLMGPDGFHPPKGTERTVSSANQDNFHYLSAVLAIRGGPSRLAASKHDTHLQEGLEGRPGKL